LGLISEKNWRIPAIFHYKEIFIDFGTLHIRAMQKKIEPFAHHGTVFFQICAYFSKKGMKLD